MFEYLSYVNRNKYIYVYWNKSNVVTINEDIKKYFC
jgi:hypothetical protein